MDFRASDWYQNKLTSILAALISAILLIFAYGHLDSSLSYRAIPQQVFLDIFNRPVGDQDLMDDAGYNPLFRKSTTLAENAEDFIKKALLTMLTYDKNDLTSGDLLRTFIVYMSENEAKDLYNNDFVNLSHQRIVLAQDGYVRLRFIGDLYFVGSKTQKYESTSNIILNSKTYKFTAKMLVTAYGDEGEEFPTLYNNVTVIAQRALLQDKINGYQIIKLEIK